MEESIGLKEMIDILKKRLLLIIMIVFIFSLAGLIIGFFVIKPVYEATATLMISVEDNQETNDILTNDKLVAAQKLASTYKVIIASKSVINKVISDLNLSTTYEHLLEDISVRQVEDTEIISISVRRRNSGEAELIANSILDTSINEISRLTSKERIKTIDRAIASNKPVNLNKFIIIILSFILGIITSILTAFYLDYMSDSPKDIEKFEMYLGLRVLGVVPSIRDGEESNL